MFKGQPRDQSCPGLISCLEPNELTIADSIFEMLAKVSKEPIPFSNDCNMKIYEDLKNLRMMLGPLLTPKVALKFDYYEVTNPLPNSSLCSVVSPFGLIQPR